MRIVRLLLIASFVAFPFTSAAQNVASGHVTSKELAVGFTRHQAAPLPAAVPSAAVAASTSGTPRWLRWGLVGAIGGAVIYTAASSGNDNAGNVVGRALTGAAVGFIIVGGSVAIYDSMCHAGGSGCR